MATTTEPKAEAKAEPKEIEEISQPPLKYKVLNEAMVNFCEHQPYSFQKMFRLLHVSNIFFSVLQTWVLRVSVHCEGCKKKINKSLKQMEGITLHS